MKAPTQMRKIFEEASDIMSQRNIQYGDYRTSFSHASALASIYTQKNFDAYEICMVMFSVKMARIAKDKHHRDSWVDAMNYLAMAQELAGVDQDAKVLELHIKKVRDDISAAINS